MAFYRTTDTELTSIADAIRTKTGDSSPLVYPTGFVSAINQLEKSKQFNILGDDLTLVNTIYDDSFALSTTDYANYTPSSTAVTFLNTSALPTITVPGNQDYILQYTGSIQFSYSSNTQINREFNYYHKGFFPLGRRSSILGNILNDTPDIFVYLDYIPRTLCIAGNSSGTLASRIGPTYGVFFTLTGPGLTGQSNANVIITPYTIGLRLATNSTYMSSSSFNELVPEDTIIKYKIELMRCNTKNNAFRVFMNMCEEMCRADYDIS